MHSDRHHARHSLGSGRAYTRRDALRVAGGAMIGGTLAACAAPVTRSAAQTNQASDAVRVDVIATGLDTPWGLAFAPDGRLFISERPGRLRVIEGGQLRESPVLTLPARETAIGEGGLMGLAIDPNFAAAPYLYVAYTAEAGPSATRNRIVRLQFDGYDAWVDRVLLDDLPASVNHNGGRVKFGPDGKLYITLGEQVMTQRAQDRDALAGKIIRLNADGSVPDDNPFPGSPVYSWGHRNPQGLAWQPGTGRLYGTEHGQSLNDEVNLIEPGANYGWPMAEGATHPEPFRSPLVAYREGTAPSGATFYDAETMPQWRGNLFFAALRGAHLHRIVLDANDPRRIVAEEKLYTDQYGRLRDVVQGPDGALYVATSNRDGRGRPTADDDRILRIGPR